MFTKHYSQAELDQWHTACAAEYAQPDDALRQMTAHAAAATGQSQRRAAPRGASAASAMQVDKPDDWASECLFDCYNS